MALREVSLDEVLGGQSKPTTSRSSKSGLREVPIEEVLGSQPPAPLAEPTLQFDPMQPSPSQLPGLGLSFGSSGEAVIAPLPVPDKLSPPPGKFQLPNPLAGEAAQVQYGTEGSFGQIPEADPQRAMLDESAQIMEWRNAYNRVTPPLAMVDGDTFEYPYDIHSPYVQNDPIILARNVELNEMALGQPARHKQLEIEELRRKYEEATDFEVKSQALISLQVAERNLETHMERINQQIAEAKSANQWPHEWMAARDAARQEGQPLPLPLKMAEEAIMGAGNAVAGLYEGATGNRGALQARREHAQWNEAVEAERDKKALSYGYGRGLLRHTASTVGAMGPALAAGAITKNPNVTFAIMSTQAGVDAYSTARLNGWDGPEAIAYGTVVAGIEFATEKTGAKVARLLHITNPEEVFVSGNIKSLMQGVAGAALEGGEEVLAEVSGNALDVYTGIDPDAFKNAKYGEVWAIGFLAGGMMQVPSYAAFMLNPTEKSAEAAGLSSLPNQEARESVANAAHEAAKSTVVRDMDNAEINARKIATAYGVDEQKFNELAAALRPETQDEWGNFVNVIRDEARSRMQPASQSGEAQSEVPADEIDPAQAGIDVSAADNSIPLAATTSESIAQAPGPSAPPLTQPLAAQQAAAEYEARQTIPPELPPQVDLLAGDEISFRGTDGQTKQGTVRRYDPETGQVDIRISGKKRLGTKQNQLQTVNVRDITGIKPQQRAQGTTNALPVAEAARSDAASAVGPIEPSTEVSRPATPAGRPAVEPVAAPAAAAVATGNTAASEPATPQQPAKPRLGVKPTYPPAPDYSNRKLKGADGNYPPNRAKSWLLDAIERRPKGVNTASEIAEWIRKRFGDDYYWRYLNQEKISLEEAIDKVQAENAARPAPTPTGQATAPAKPWTRESLQQRLREVAKTPDEADATFAIIEARAKSLGMSIAEWANKRLRDVSRLDTAPKKKQQDDTFSQSDFRSGVDRSTLAEKRRGEIQLHKDGTATIRVFQDAQDLSTLVHELGHLFLLDLPDSDMAIVEPWAGVKDGKWTREAHEKWARGFERYLADGQAPTPELKSVFEKFKQWLLSIYKAIKGSKIDINISPEIKAVMDRMLTPKSSPEAKPRLQSKKAGEEKGSLGYNSDGEEVFEDKDGVRYVVSDGVKIQEKVSLRPERTEGGGIRYVSSVDPASREDRFKASTVSATMIESPGAAASRYGPGEPVTHESHGRGTVIRQDGDNLVVHFDKDGDFNRVVDARKLKPTPGDSERNPEPHKNVKVVDEAADYGTLDEPNRVELGKHFASILATKSIANIAEARQIASELVGGKIEPGTQAAKDVDEAVEQGVVRAARDIIAKGMLPEATFNALIELYNRQPNLSVRTSTSMQQQAYSTPAPIAFLLQHLADVTPETVSYDSSAGNGMLLTASKNPVANELNPERVSSLQEQGIETTQHDATSYRPKRKFKAVTINPPFGAIQENGRNKVWNVDGIQTEQIDHAITLNTLPSMASDGKTVIIIGSKGFESGKPKPNVNRASAYSAQKAFYDALYSRYNVVDHFTVSGDLYSKQGAKFPVDIIVVDGEGTSSRPRPWNFKENGLPKVYQTWEELLNDKIKGNVGSVQGPGSRSGPKSQASDLGGIQGTSEAEDSSDGQGPTPATGSDSGNVGAEGGRRPGSQRPSGPSRPERVPSDTKRNDRPGPEQIPAGDQPAGTGTGRGPAADPGLAGTGAVDQAALDEAINNELDDILGPSADKPRIKTIADKAAEARARFKESSKALIDALKDPGTTLTSTGVNPKLVKLAVRAAVDAVEAGGYTFAEYAAGFYEQAPEMMDQLAPYLERAWELLRGRDPSNGQMGETGRISDLYPAKKKSQPQETETEFQVAYTPKSKNGQVGTLLPVNQAQAITRALDNVEVKHGDIDKFVAKELGYTSKQLEDFFSAEQVDALALAISNDKSGQAFILSDQTGVGKGRVVAGMIRYAKKKGLVPVFLTEKPSLYADMMRDLTAIGMNDDAKPFNPLITNGMTGNDAIDLNSQTPGKPPRVIKQGTPTAKRIANEAIGNLDRNGKLTAKIGNDQVEYDAVFTTYAQTNPVRGSTSWRHDFLNMIRERSYLILDESHNALGSKQEGQEDDSAPTSNAGFTRAEFLRNLIDFVANVMYSSATFAKRPEVMDLYSRAGMRDAVSNIANLPGAIARGGVPMQQAVSEMLAEAGLMIRRERSYAGVDFSPKLVDVGEDAPDRTSSIFRGIHQFSELRNRAIGKMEKDLAEDMEAGSFTDDVVSGGGQIGNDTSTGTSGIDSTNFTSILWNLADQMLVSLKSTAVAEEAIAAYKRNEKPVITIDNTMESALDRYIEENGIQEGDVIDFGFRDYLMHYLRRSREVLIKRDRSDPNSWEQHYLTDEELGPEALAAYRDVESQIRKFKEDMPASPIDWMRYKMTEAKMKVAEITGREWTIDYSGGNINRGVLTRRAREEVGTQGKTRTVNGYNNGDLDGMIINRSGSTGLSAHASRDFKDTRQRHMIIAQAAKNIDEFMQSLGRIHRTGQITLPRYTLFMTNAPAENRPAAVLLKKLKSLNANVTGSAGGNVSFDVPDLINSVGDHVVANWIIENVELNEEMANPAKFNRDGQVTNTNGLAKKVSGRMVLLPLETQKRFWEEIVDGFEQRIAQLEAANQNPLKAPTLDLDARSIERIPLSEGTEGSSNPFQQPAYLERVDAKKIGKPYLPEEVTQQIHEFYGVKSDLELKAAHEKWEKKLLADAEERKTKWEQEHERKQILKWQESVEGLDPVERTRRLDSFDQRLANARNQRAEQWRNIRSAIEGYQLVPGQVVTYTPSTIGPTADSDTDSGEANEGITGVIVAVHPPKSGNVTAPSRWSVDIALADTQRRVRLNYAPHSLQLFDRSSKMMSTALQEFREAGAVGREERYIATGNLLTAAEQIKKANVVFYRDSSGEVKRGMLTPRNFRADQWLEARPAVFGNGKDVLTFLKEGGRAQTVDGTLLITHNAGNLIVIAPKARSRSGKYTVNPDLLAASRPAEFVSVGQRMELAVATERNKAKVLDAIMKIGGIQANADRELARQMDSDGRIKLVAGGIVQAEATGEELGDNPVAYLKSPRRLSVSVNQSLSQRIGSPEDKAGIAAQDIMKTWERIFNIPIRSGGFSQRAESLYKRLPETIRVKEKHIANLAVAAHEIAHHIDKQTKISNTGSLASHLRNELAGLDYEPKGRVFEGFAEYIRHWITEEDAEFIAPQFTKYFEETWMSAHPEIAKQLKEARTHARQFADQSVFQRVKALIGNNPGDDLEWAERFTRKAKSGLMRLYSNLAENTYTVAQLDKRLRSRGYKGISIEKAVLAYRMSDRHSAAKALEEGVFDFKTGELISRDGGYWNRIKKHLNNDVEVDESTAYAHARHTMFMDEKKPGYNTGMSVEDAQSIIDYVSQDQDKLDRYDKVADTISQFAHELLDMAVRAGRFPHQERNRIVSYYGDNYFPLWRVKANWMQRLTGGKGYFNLPKLVKGRTQGGSGEKIMNPHDVIQAMAVEYYRGAAQSRISQLVVEALDPEKGGVEGMGYFFEKIDPKTTVHQGQVFELLKTLVDEGIVDPDDARAMVIAAKLLNNIEGGISSKDWDWFADRHNLRRDPDGHLIASDKEIRAAAELEPNAAAQVFLYRPNYTPSPGKRIAVHYDKDGNPTLYQFDEDMYNAFVAMGDVHLPMAAEYLESMVRVFKAGAVTASTGFAVQNLPADLQEYVGRAEQAKGKDVFTKPITLGAEYVWYKTQQALGKSPPSNALFDTFDEMGGRLYTAIGQDKVRLQRERHRRLAVSKKKKLAALVKHPMEGFAEGLSVFQDVIATTDVPARLAEMEASIRRDGYEKAGDKWRDLNTGYLIDRLPEHVRINGIYAAGEATTNFGRRGNWYRVTELFLPLSSAGFQALRRRAGLIASLKSIGQKGNQGDKARRYATYLGTMFFIGIAKGLIRSGDDDEKEGEDWLYSDYWITEGDKPGMAGSRMRKPRDAAAVINAGEMIGAAIRGAETRKTAGGIVGRDVANSIPSGGGLLRSLSEAFVTNKDYFLDREVEPYYMSRETPSEYRFNENTSGASKSLGWYTGRYLGISPVQVEHVLAGTTGGLYRRIANTWDAAMNGKIEAKHLPFLRGISVNRHQAQSMGDFYYDLGKAAEAAERANQDIKYLGDSKERQQRYKAAKIEADRLDEYGELMTAIRKAEKSGLGKRTYEFEPYLVGLAREALGRQPLESNPNPLAAKDLPETVREVAYDFSETKAKAGIRYLGWPKQQKDETDTAFADRRQQWQENQQSADRWLESHKDSPIVREAIKAVVAKGSPGIHGDESIADYNKRLKRWEEWQKLVE